MATKKPIAKKSEPEPVKPLARKRKKKLSKKTILLIVLLLVIIGAGVYGGWRYMQARQEIKRLSDPKVAAEQETHNLVQQVGKLVQIPENETPTIATVNDVSKLSQQPFFANAQNGDKVLIFTQARKAVLYRPSTNKVIEVAPVNLGSSEDQAKPAGQ